MDIETPEDENLLEALIWNLQMPPEMSDNGAGHNMRVAKDRLRKALAARDALLRADERQKAAGWISVKERLPESGMEVLACGNNYNNALKGQHRVVVNFIENQFFVENGEGERDRMDYITHWMLLPEPPAIMSEPEEAHS